MKEHRRVICRVSTERSDDSCAGPSLLHDDSVYCIIGWSDLAFFFYQMGVFHELDLLVLRPFVI